MSKTNQLIIITLGIPIMAVLYVLVGAMWVYDRLPTVSIKLVMKG